MYSSIFIYLKGRVAEKQTELPSVTRSKGLQWLALWCQGFRCHLQGKLVYFSEAPSAGNSTFQFENKKKKEIKT